MVNLEVYSKIKAFGGYLHRCKHISNCLGGIEMQFSVFLPSNHSKKTPQIYWLSGLTCTDENFITKAGAFKTANELHLALIVPDTSPRGEDVPDSPSYDLGQGAGFYINAIKEPWKKNYQMYDYVTKELPELVNSSFAVNPSNISIMGHSMGGHGAISIALKNPIYKSASAFAPVLHPTKSKWEGRRRDASSVRSSHTVSAQGIKVFNNYLGEENSKLFEEYDSYLLAQNYSGRPIDLLIDQGTEDSYLSQLMVTDFDKMIKDHKSINATVRLQEGYDHSYFFVSTFIDDHLRFHSKHLNEAEK